MAEINSDIKKAFDILMTMNHDKETRALYLSREMALRDELSRIEEGRSEGRAEGRAEGRIEGLEEGKYEKSIEIAKNLLDVLDDETIAVKTGISIEKIKSLRRK